MGEKLRQALVELRIVADDRGYGGGHGFLQIALGESGGELFLRLPRLHENNARRAAVGAGRAPFHQLVETMQHLVRNGLVEPCVMRARMTENDIERVVAQHAAHRRLLARRGIGMRLRTGNPVQSGTARTSVTSGM